MVVLVVYIVSTYLQETYFLEHSKRAFVNIYLTWQNSIPLRYIK
jgi:hypothetical protein